MLLCGHQFHVGCTNKLLYEHQEVTTQCPVCSDTRDAASVLRKAAAAAGATAMSASTTTQSCCICTGTAGTRVDRMRQECPYRNRGTRMVDYDGLQRYG